MTSQYGNGSDRLHLPIGLALNFNNTLYIADYQNHRIQMYLPGTSTGKTVAGFFNATAGSGSSGLNSCSDVLIDSDGNLYIADMGNNRIQFWSNGASYGATVAGSGK